MHSTTSHIPTCVGLDEVADPQSLWDLVMEGETLPGDDVNSAAQEGGN